MQKLNKLFNNSLGSTPRKSLVSATMSSSPSEQQQLPPTLPPENGSPALQNGTSQPESLDLDYDMWQGQFEFVGPNPDQLLDATSTSSLEDLRFNDYIPPNQPVLIDEETFLSLHPNDFDSISGPESSYFIENSRTNYDEEIIENSPKNNLSQNNLQSNNSNNSFFVNKLNNNLSIEAKNVKNNLINSNLKLINDNPELSHKLLFKTNKLNGRKTELCDNLNEQVSCAHKKIVQFSVDRNCFR
jgi:Rab11 family-interacting protein 3/4